MDGGTGSRLVGVKIVLEQRSIGGCTCLLWMCTYADAVPSSGGGVAVGW